MILSFDQIRKYFETRLSRSLPTRDKIAVKCCFHDDSTPSATVFLSGNGGFNCSGCGAKGNIFQFETRFSNCDLSQAKINIAEITGAASDESDSRGHCTAIYDYRKTDGTMAFQKRRFENSEGQKTFMILRQDASRGWQSGIGDVTRVLYNLPQLVTANLVLLPEGEKDSDTLANFLTELFPERPDLRITTTTNFEGAWKPNQSPKWLDAYNAHFTGKQVVLFEDNDESGLTRAEYIANAILPFAEGVRYVTFRDMPVKSDVSDWMKGHTIEDLRELIRKAPRWQRSESRQERKVFVDFADFVTQTPLQIDWMVGGIIERGANGFIAAEPKGSKSFVATDLCISLATGSPWIEFSVPKPTKVGLISREDNPALTGWRLKHLMMGKTLSAVQLNMLEENLYVNTRAQTPTLMLDNEEEMDELKRAIKKLQLEFIVLDVFNVLHTADENDNRAMRVVLNKCKHIQEQTGASIGIIHHYRKGIDNTHITEKLRGASAISGFAEWIVGINMADEDMRVRRMEFELKAACPPEPIYFVIDAQENSPAYIKRAGSTPQPPKRQPSIMKNWHDKEN